MVGGEDVPSEEFVEFICGQASIDQESHWRCQVDELCFKKVSYDLIGKVENFQKDLGRLLEMLFTAEDQQRISDISKLDASPMKTGSSGLIDEYYSDSMKKKVADRYEEGFLLFGYDVGF